METESRPVVEEMIAETVDERTEEKTDETPEEKTEETVESKAVNEEKEMELSEPEVRSNEHMEVEAAKSATEDEPMDSSEGKDGKHEEASDEAAESAPDGGNAPQTPSRRRRGRPAKAAAIPKTEVATPGKRGRKRANANDTMLSTASNVSVISSVKRGKRTKTVLSYEDFITWEAGQRVLSCGDGDQLGHPGRSTTKKPRKVDIVEDEEMVVAQVVAGGVHSAILTVDGTVYSCGINEKGTVPAEGVEAEGSTDEFKKIIFSEEIKKHGKIVMLSAGASFTAALTDKGSVIAWGNLRDASGMIDVHQQLVAMQTHPIVVIHNKHDLVVVKIAAGENHLVMLSSDGRVFTFGDSSMGQLGRSVRLNHVRSQYMASENSLVVPIMHKRKSVKCKNIFAGGFWTAMLSNDNELFVCGLNNFSHLGIPTEEMKAKEEVADKPEGTETDDRELRIMRPDLSTQLTGQNWTNFDGVQHIAVRNDKGEIYCIGKNTDNALGMGTWSESDRDNNWKYDTLQKLDIEECAGVAARLGCSIAWTPSGSAYAWGFDSSGQLGLGLKDDDEKVVPKPEKISSAHLDGYKIVQVSVADNHALFLAVKTD